MQTGVRTLRIVRTIELGAEALQLMLGRAPRIGVSGLNPHMRASTTFSAGGILK